MVLINTVLMGQRSRDYQDNQMSYGIVSWRGVVGLGAIFYIFSFPTWILMLVYRRDLMGKGTCRL